MAKHCDTVPIEVTILTADHDIKGIVHVSKYTNTNRELTDLLNDKERRFLAVTNAEIYPRTGNQSPRRYNFLEIHMDYVVYLLLLCCKSSLILLGICLLILPCKGKLKLCSGIWIESSGI